MTDEILLVNVATGEEILADHYKLVELGYPLGFVPLESITHEELWKMLKEAKENIGSF